MKNTFKLTTLAATFIALFFLTSCEKDEGKLPNIAFKTTTGYTSADKTVAAGSSVLIGINASKAEDKDVLKTFTISKTVNGGASVSVESTPLSGTLADSYSPDYTVTAAAVGTVEKYTFTVVNRDGLTNSVSLSLTSN